MKKQYKRRIPYISKNCKVCNEEFECLEYSKKTTCNSCQCTIAQRKSRAKKITEK